MGFHQSFSTSPLGLVVLALLGGVSKSAFIVTAILIAARYLFLAWLVRTHPMAHIKFGRYFEYDPRPEDPDS
jgi:hypothetical protein